MRIAKLEGECPHEPWLLGDLNKVNAVNRVSHPPEQALGAPRRARRRMRKLPTAHCPGLAGANSILYVNYPYMIK
jgi:hypothetical protein